jgi:hypothetical protein
MFTEIIKFIARIDSTRLKQMFDYMNKRFTAISKRFNKGMKAAMKLTGVAAVAGLLIDKLVNPLKQAEEIIDRISKYGSDAKDVAEDLGTDPGTLLRLQGLAGAKGVDQDTLRSLLDKFRTALVEEQVSQSRNEPAGPLRQFTRETDMSEAFLKFLFGLKQLGGNEQLLVQNQIFGEKLRGKTRQFFNAPGDEIAAILARLPSAESLASAADRAATMGGLADRLKAIRELNDFVEKAGKIEERHVKGLDEAARGELKSENKALGRFDSSKSTTIAVQELSEKFEQLSTTLIGTTLPAIVTGINLLTGWIEKLYNMVNGFIGSMKQSRWWKF